MPYQITSVMTKNSADDPNFDEWLASLDSGFLDSEYPEWTGNTPSEVVSSMVGTHINDPATGFISEESSVNDDNTVWTWTSLWESQSAWFSSQEKGEYNTVVDKSKRPAGNITASTTSATITGVGTSFLTDVSVTDTIFERGGLGYNPPDPNETSDPWEVLGVVKSIESDTSLTLTANSAHDIESSWYYIEPKKSALVYLQNLYDETYPKTVTTTEANI